MADFQNPNYRGDLYPALDPRAITAPIASAIGDYIGRKREKDSLLAQLSQYQGDDDEDATAGQADEPGADSMGQLEQQGQKATALRKLIQTYNPNLKNNHLSGLNVDQLEGIVKGAAVNSEMQDRSTNRQLMLAHLSDYMAQAGLRNQNAKDDQSVGLALNRLGDYFNQPGTPGRNTDLTGEGNVEDTTPPNFSDAVNYALKTPGLAGRNVPKLLDAITRYGSLLDKTGRGAEALQPNYTEDPVTGARALTYGKQAIPTGVNPEKVPVGTQPTYDADSGELIGHTVTDIKGRATFQPLKAAPVVKVPESFHSAMDTLTQQITGDQDKVDDSTLKAEDRAAAGKRLARRQKVALDTLKRYRATGSITDEAYQDQLSALGLQDTDASPGKAAAPGKGTKLTPDVAATLLKQAGGDKTKARALATARGYSF